MREKNKKIYVTEDGKEFDSKSKAEYHERKLDKFKKVQIHLKKESTAVLRKTVNGVVIIGKNSYLSSCKKAYGDSAVEDFIRPYVKSYAYSAYGPPITFVNGKWNRGMEAWSIEVLLDELPPEDVQFVINMSDIDADDHFDYDHEISSPSDLRVCESHTFPRGIKNPKKGQKWVKCKYCDQKNSPATNMCCGEWDWRGEEVTVPFGSRMGKRDY